MKIKFKKKPIYLSIIFKRALFLEIDRITYQQLEAI